ncbi:MAG: iron-sulfur cluster assembly accessory protein [Proteobacteria bacterium TMED51]|jgi:iron-sulfur cluster assembly protein|nr:MAG: iron-sulfur cluster assembly protein IscA [Candidatus Thioglobus sp. MED-G23]RPG01435.1 MAG: iron-sulfur cluster assembly accessory protein [Proteobacteria bacterium TMED51]HBP85989.1 iron-sulfur cluster assembly protein IscA [Gammaproteobacteria bacterium]|tara:strand:+ start:2652 stop:2984 length:333 start_codon:yes stop_codon:yes gene_type:complete
MAITLTEAAAQRVSDHLESRGHGEGLRLGVKTTGCSGLAYVVDFADEISPEDQVFTSRGVKVIVDGDSIKYIDGTEIDFASDGFSTAFRFKNPNVADECGCGESFTVNPS